MYTYLFQNWLQNYNIFSKPLQIYSTFFCFVMIFCCFHPENRSLLSLQSIEQPIIYRQNAFKMSFPKDILLNSSDILSIYIICQPYTIPAEVEFVTVFYHSLGIND